MNRGDLIKLKREDDLLSIGLKYDWGYNNIPKKGFYLKDPITKNDLNESDMGIYPPVDFSNEDLCLILEVHDVYLLVLNPRLETGFIHHYKVEAA